MEISVEEARRIAALAKLEFDERELERHARQLSAILDYVERLDRLDTTGIDPDPCEAAAESRLRPDTPLPCLEAREALANAPESDHGHFRVPRVIP